MQKWKLFFEVLLTKSFFWRRSNHSFSFFQSYYYFFIMHYFYQLFREQNGSCIHRDRYIKEYLALLGMLNKSHSYKVQDKASRQSLRWVKSPIYSRNLSFKGPRWVKRLICSRVMGLRAKFGGGREVFAVGPGLCCTSCITSAGARLRD